MDGVTIISGLILVSIIAVVVLWFTRNKGVVGKRVVVGESTPIITSMPQDSTGKIDPTEDWEIVPVIRTRRMRGHKHGSDESVSEPLLEPLRADVSAHAVQQDAVTYANGGEQSAADKPPGSVPKNGEYRDVQEPSPETPRELIVVLNIIASQEQWLDGPRVVNAVRSAGMQYGDPGIFHYVSSTHPQGEPLFSLVNILNPGIFKMDEIEQLTTPGVTLFMRLTGTSAAPMNGQDAFTRMHDTAQQLARVLNADVYDERRLILTDTAALALRDKIVQHQRSVVTH